MNRVMREEAMWIMDEVSCLWPEDHASIEEWQTGVDLLFSALKFSDAKGLSAYETANRVVDALYGDFDKDEDRATVFEIVIKHLHSSKLVESLSDERHVETRGKACPYCRGTEVEARGKADVGPDTALQLVVCPCCQAEYYDVYALIGWSPKEPPSHKAR